MAEADPKGEGAIDVEEFATRICPPKKWDVIRMW
jgi:hypothetical protein